MLLNLLLNLLLKMLIMIFEAVESVDLVSIVKAFDCWL